MAALDVTNGQTLWQGAGDSRPGYATPVIAKLNGRTQIVAFLAEGMLGIDPATGERLWTFPWVVDHQQNSATPLVRGNTIFYSTAWGKGSGMLDVSDNQPKVLWQSKQMQARFPTPVISHERIYGTQDPGKLVCLDAKTGNLLWQQTGFEFASTIAVDDCIVVQ